MSKARWKLSKHAKERLFEYFEDFTTMAPKELTHNLKAGKMEDVTAGAGCKSPNRKAFRMMVEQQTVVAVCNIREKSVITILPEKDRTYTMEGTKV